MLILRAVAWSIAIVAGFLQAWATRFWTSADATNYLDLASAYLRHDWHNAINAYWSPLFSWLLALGFLAFQPSPFWETTLLHLTNFVGLLIGLLCFEFFFRALLRLQNQLTASGTALAELPESAWWTLGYTVFLSTAIFVQTTTATTPDIWVAAWTYLIVGLLLCIWQAGGGWRLFALLGFILALAYLTKTFYFPISFIFIPVAWMAAGNVRKNAWQPAVALLAFFAVAGPWIFALSENRHRLTFGDTGKLNFAMMIDDIPQPFLWQGEDGTGVPTHPVRKLLDRPRIFEFAAPIAATYPPGYDAPYWMDGVRPRFRLHGLFRVLRQSAGTFFEIYLLQAELAVGAAALLFLVIGKHGWSRPFWRLYYLWLPPLIGCAAYSVVHVELRLVGPFVAPLWVALFAGLLRAASDVPRRVLLALILAMSAATGLRIAKSMTSDLASALAPQVNTDWQIAQGLRAAGLQPGDTVSDFSLAGEAHWARLAGLKIVAELPLGDEYLFWLASNETKQRIFRILAATGAKMAIAKNPPPSALNEGWLPLAQTGFFAHPLPSQGLSVQVPRP